MNDVANISISISRPAGGPLVLSADESATLGVARYVRPGKQPRHGYAPGSADMHGLVLLSATYQQAFLSFDVLVDRETTSAGVRAAVSEIEEAVGQFSFTATVTEGDAPAEVWACDMGSVIEGERTHEELRDKDAICSVTIPVYPIPGA